MIELVEEDNSESRDKARDTLKQMLRELTWEKEKLLSQVGAITLQQKALDLLINNESVK